MFHIAIADQIATVEMNNPPVNALTREWGEALAAALDELEKRRDWQVMRLRSRDKVFSAGANLKVFATRFEQSGAGALLAEEAGFYQRLFARIEALPQVSIAEIHGAATGGGFELALACDLRIAADNARIGLPEVGIGLLPGAGGTQRLTKLCGRSVAIRMILGSELVDSTEALRLGMVDWVVSATDLAAFADTIARRFAAGSAVAAAAAKRCIAAAFDAQRDGFKEELDWTAKLIHNADSQQRIRAFLAGKRGRD